MLDETEFGRLLVATYDDLYRSALGLTRDVLRAEDLVQSTVVRALSNRDRYDATRPIKPWLMRILQRVLFDESRAARVQRNTYQSFSKETRQYSEPTQEHSVDLKRILAHLETLKSEYREAICLAALGYSNSQVVVLMQARLGSVKAYIRRGRVQLLNA